MSERSDIRVLILAPTPALRAGLRALLDAPGIAVVGEAGAPLGAGAAMAGADLLLVGDDAALADLRRALAGEPRLAALLLSDDERAVAALRALPLTSWGVAPRDTSPAELQAAALAVAQGLVVLPPAMAARLVGQRLPEPTLDPPAEALTARELEVLALLAEGLPNKQIARALQISDHTVKFHISAIFAKLGAASRTDAVGRAARQGLIAL